MMAYGIKVRNSAMKGLLGIVDDNVSLVRLDEVGDKGWEDVGLYYDMGGYV